MDAGKVLTDLSGGSPLLPAYVLVGEEDYLKDQVVARIKSRALGSGTGGLGLESDGGLNYQAFDGRDTPAAAITQMAETFPFLAERRLIVVKDPDLSDPAWAKYLESPQPTTCLVLYCHGDQPARTLGPLKEAGKKGHVAVVESAAPKPRDLVAWVSERARDFGKVLPRDAAQILIEAIGPNLLTLDGEMQKMATYIGAKPVIAAADVQAVVGRVTIPQVFEFVDAVVAGDAGAALARLSEMLGQPGAELQILATVHGHYRRMAVARSMLDDRMPADTILPRLYGNPWAARKCLDQARGLTASGMKRAISRLFETDLAIKTGQREPRLALELLSLDLCTLGAAARGGRAAQKPV